ncbi:hypothetical protein Tco_0579730, partial [Tanacetum coccineum]
MAIDKPENTNTPHNSDDDDASVLGDEQPPPAPLPTTTSVASMKIPPLKKGEYDIWAMKFEYYMMHTDNAVWEVILK